jgi:CheY-like chemotaxis protein
MDYMPPKESSDSVEASKTSDESSGKELAVTGEPPADSTSEGLNATGGAAEASGERLFADSEALEASGGEELYADSAASDEPSGDKLYTDTDAPEASRGDRLYADSEAAKESSSLELYVDGDAVEESTTEGMYVKRDSTEKPIYEGLYTDWEPAEQLDAEEQYADWGAPEQPAGEELYADAEAAEELVGEELYADKEAQEEPIGEELYVDADGEKPYESSGKELELAGETSPAGRTKRILVADDDPFMRELLDLILSGAGYDVMFAEDGQTAVKMVAAERFDLLLSDCLLPKLHGFEVCKAVKALPDPPKVVMLTGVYTKPTYKWQLMREYGADAVINKPVESPKLLSCIAEQLLAKDDHDMIDVNGVWGAISPS